MSSFHFKNQEREVAQSKVECFVGIEELVSQKALFKIYRGSASDYSVGQVFQKWPNPGLFFIYLCLFKHTLQILHQRGVLKNAHPVYGAGIWTHDLWNMGLLS